MVQAAIGALRRGMIANRRGNRRVPDRCRVEAVDLIVDELDFAEEANQPVGFRLIVMAMGRVGVHDG